MLDLWRRLAANGVIGLNRRNAEFILAYNSRRNYPLVDDKLLTKQLAEKAGVAIPKLYSVVEFPGQVRGLAEALAPYEDFVVKPARGSGGDGIIVVSGRSHELFRTAGGTLISRTDLEFHVNNILSGTYSLGGLPDKALIEYRVKFDPLFERIAYQGVPDIRIIVFLGVPVMAMVRLPTRQSGGKANLHQGAIGAGIDIATGRTLKAVWKSRIVTDHPDTGNPVMGLQIPQWDMLLMLGARSLEMTGLGYQGIDIVLDRELGPLVLELNARPGLAIQIANGVGIGKRLEKVQAEAASIADPAERVRYAKENFGARP